MPNPHDITSRPTGPKLPKTYAVSVWLTGSSMPHTVRLLERDAVHLAHTARSAVIDRFEACMAHVETVTDTGSVVGFITGELDRVEFATADLQHLLAQEPADA